MRSNFAAPASVETPFRRESSRKLPQDIQLACGFVYVGKRRGDYATPLSLPSYGRRDLSAYIENQFNARYETGSINQYQVYPGAPTNFRLQLGANF